jgi:5-methylcytosine-specific restriction protein A
MGMSERSGSGRELNKQWEVGAQHALYHHSGTWYHILERFPGAFFDKDGYVLFPTKNEFVNCSELHVGKHVRVPSGISRISGYTKVRA